MINGIVKPMCNWRKTDNRMGAHSVGKSRSPGQR